MTKQKDPNGIGAHDGGAKLDAGKNRISLLFMQYFPNAIDAITSISEFGARKYSPGGWKKVPDGYQRYTDAMGRHYLADCKGEIFDDETKLPHDYQIAWNALARIECAIMEGKYGMKLSKPDAEIFIDALSVNNTDIGVSTGNEVIDEHTLLTDDEGSILPAGKNMNETSTTQYLAMDKQWIKCNPDLYHHIMSTL